MIDHIGDPNLVMNPIPDALKPTKPPEPPIYQSGAGSPLRRATADIPVDMEWVNEYMLLEVQPLVEKAPQDTYLRLFGGLQALPVTPSQ